MRLICGLWHLDGQPARQETLCAMARAMIAEGLRPRLGVWHDGPVGFASVDFSPDAELTPTRDARGRVLAGDIRLDDPDALAQALGTPRVTGDELMLAAIERWGADAPVRILGDYAFAAWDSRTHTLLCGRDALGIRPLAYSFIPGKLFAFASMPCALHGSGLIERRLNQRALVARLLASFDPAETLISGVLRLPAGHTLEIGAGGPKIQRYWQLDESTAGTRELAPADAAAQMRHLIKTAVDSRLPRSGAAAAHLSGGLDSSALAILAARRLRHDGRQLLTYSFAARAPSSVPLEDESPFVQAVLEQEPDLVWTPIYSPQYSRILGARLDIDRMQSLEADDPENAICIHAAAHGATVMFSGWGGDEGATFNGRGALAEGILHGRWRYVASEIAALRKVRGWSLGEACAGEIGSYLSPEWLLRRARRVRGRPAGISDIFRCWLAPGVARNFASATDQLKIGPDARHNRLRLLSSPHIAERTENWANIGARQGIAFVFPMLDRRVVEFALSLPSSLFLRGGYKRRLHRDAMEGVLPELIRWRHNKLVPLPEHLPNAVAARDLIVQHLERASHNPAVRAIFDIDRLRADAANLPSRADLSSSSSEHARMQALGVCGTLTPIAYLEQHY
jgi:asparagine synthase (glutamine-hydrolysing)